MNQPVGYHHNWIGQILPYIEEGNTYRHIDFGQGVYHKNNRKVRKLTLTLLVCPSSTEMGPRSDYAGVHHDVEAPSDTTNNGVFFLNSRVTYEDVSDGSSHTLFIGEKSYANKNDLGWMSGTRATLRNTGTPPTQERETEDWAASTWDDEYDHYSTAPYGVDGDGASDADSLGKDADGKEDAQNADDVDADGTDEENDPAGKKPDMLYVGGFGSLHPGGVLFAMGDGSIRFVFLSMSPTVYRQLGHRSDGQLLDDW